MSAPLFVPVADEVVAVHDLGGTGTGPPVVLLHAISFNAPSWSAIARRLAVPSRIVAVDLPGHGLSTMPEGDDLRWRDFAETIAAAVRKLDLERSVAVGHSMGGALATLVALAHPVVFRGLWLYEPVVPPLDVTTVGEPAHRRARPAYPSRDHAYANYAGKPPMNLFDPEVLRSFVDHAFDDLPDGTVTLRCDAGRTERLAQDWNHHRAFARLREIACPVVVAHGREIHYQAAWVPPIAAAIPGATVEVFDDLTHLGPMEDPAATAAAIDRFVASLA